MAPFRVCTYNEVNVIATQTFPDGPEPYDLLVLGSGEGGKYLAWTLAKQGQRVAVVERKWIGGSCPNIACLPSKNLIQSAKVAQYFKRGGEFGLSSAGYTVDMAGVRDRKRKMVAGLVELNANNYRHSGAELILGEGHFVAPRTLRVRTEGGSERLLTGKQVVIGTGTHATLDNIRGLLEAVPLTHVEAMELDVVPRHLLVLGGGYVGLEFAQAFRRFGSQVTIIERNERLLSREDEDVSVGMSALFNDEGITVLLNSNVVGATGVSGALVKLELTQQGSSIVLEGSHLLVATGRTPNTAEIGLELAGVELTSGGYVKVNDHLQTTAESTWAIGECAGSEQFTHIAFDDFRVIRDSLAGISRSTAGRQVPSCLFTDPELAHIGLRETDAASQGIAYRLAKIPMSGILRTHTLSETRGFAKALVDVKSDKILGFTCFGQEAGELMGAVQIAMIAGLPYTKLREAILTHPTMAEGLVALFSSL